MAKTSKKTTLPENAGELKKLIRDSRAEMLKLRFAFGPSKDRATQIQKGRKTIAKAENSLRNLARNK